MLKVIINADDLGKNHEVNKAIETCIKSGLITSTTLMAGGAAFEEGVAIALRHPEISVGVHLTIDEEQSLTQSPVFLKYGITKENGEFVKGAIGKIKKLPSDLKLAINEEWVLQVQRVKEAGVKVSHVDSHHHYHTLPSLQCCLLHVTNVCHVNKVRLRQLKTVDMMLHHVKTVSVIHKNEKSENKTISSKKPSRVRIVKDYLMEIIRQMIFKYRYKTTDFFCSYLFFFENRDYLLNRMKGKVVELMCHPGHPDYIDETSKLIYNYKEIEKINYWQL